MKRFSKVKSDEFVKELVSITFDVTGVDTDLERLHTKCITALRELLWSDLNSKRTLGKYIRLHLPHTIHQTIMLCIIEGGLSIEASHKFIMDSFEFCVPTLDELGIY